MRGSAIFEITEHALLRYVHRVLGVGCECEDDEEVKGVCRKYINDKQLMDTVKFTMSEMIMNSDIVFSDYRNGDDVEENVTYFVYQDIIFVFVGGHIRTVYRSRITDYEEINNLKKMMIKHRKLDGVDSLNTRNYASILIGHGVLKGII